MKLSDIMELTTSHITLKDASNNLIVNDTDYIPPFMNDLEVLSIDSDRGNTSPTFTSLAVQVNYDNDTKALDYLSQRIADIYEDLDEHASDPADARKRMTRELKDLRNTLDKIVEAFDSDNVWDYHL